MDIPEGFKEWLINEVGLTPMKAYDIIDDLDLPFPVNEEALELIKAYKAKIKSIKTERITIRLEKKSMDELKRIAKDNNMKIGEVIRPAIHEFIENYIIFERRIQNEEKKRKEVRGQRSIQEDSSINKKM